MKNNATNAGIILWIARIISIGFALFISIFAMDVFSENIGFWKTGVALLIHLIPTFVIVLIVIISWHKAWIAGFAFMLLGILHVIVQWGKLHWSGYAVISAPIFILSVLFFIGWYQQEKHAKKLT